ncbi:hypothetical protein HBN50_11040 [Halobacteriovorax sp. GB3]|uniref:hypothetical protein n=1 Tax=Halobacteriovorax sp. GB3 TaxID=2719615 RepID=UPI0023629378|nr:hypothetical protein [Halobacteriovorax sp. GB3]MDD0853639.1 hypothetical protein [Halobacteriovorax sp. GB3]
MKKYAVIFLLMTTSFISMGSANASEDGPLTRAFEEHVSKAKFEVDRPQDMDTETLGTLVSEIYSCYADKVEPCDRVKGDKQYQIDLVSTYLRRLDLDTREHTIATALLLKMKYNGKTLDKMIELCSKYSSASVLKCN